VSKLKTVDKLYVKEAEERLAKTLKASKTEIIERAQAKLDTAKKSRRSLKNDKETALEQKARGKLERLKKDFEGERKRTIAKKRYIVQ